MSREEGGRVLGPQQNNRLVEAIAETRAQGLYKAEQPIAGPQGPWVALADGTTVLNMCANNYLGLSSNTVVVEAAREALAEWGFGTSSVRFICGTQTLHHRLEAAVSEFLGTEDTILYSSCFDANGGLFETLLGAEDAVISDALNHASIIDGIRLSKATRYRYRNRDLDDLQKQLKAASQARTRLIASDGAFSMDGTIAPLQGICDLAERYDALVMVDDSHAVGVLGKLGRGSHEHCGVQGRVDILTGTFGKALGGASGGYTSGRKSIVDVLRQRSRPYLFSNSVAPVVAAGSLRAIEMLQESAGLVRRLRANTSMFREGMQQLGFALRGDEHPIVPVMLGEARAAQEFAAALLARRVYAVGFCYPVVPKGEARVRVQVSAGHTAKDLEFALAQFELVGAELGHGHRV
jgi:glycine C-acetyltransferase